jgi:hypothetical protein
MKWMTSIFENVKPPITQENLINKVQMNEETCKDLLQLELLQQQTTRWLDQLRSERWAGCRYFD